MTEKELRKLSRADLLEMLIEQSTEIQMLREKLSAAEAALQEKELKIDKAGSIAEAALQLNGIFEAAQAASQQYIDNIKMLNERQEALCKLRDQESREQAAQRLSEAERKSTTLEYETKVQCAEMVQKAKVESQVYWDELSGKLETFYQEHVGLQELLSAFPVKKEQG
ncbi:MAG: hypothetical protein ACI4EG_15000 [Fusicatenibacter sp.]|nr:hypothetical protein [Fusicatenibacter sp.]